jgi:hypothetical protein
MTERMPWEKPAEPSPYDPTMFIRLRVKHGTVTKYVGVRADDTDITGVVKLDDGSELMITLWGIPSRNEAFMRTDDVMREVIKYVVGLGLTVI